MVISKVLQLNPLLDIKRNQHIQMQLLHLDVQPNNKKKTHSVKDIAFIDVKLIPRT